MELFSSSWRSLANSIDNLMDFLESRLNILNQKRFGRFILGCIMGIFPVLVYWGYAVFFRVDIPPSQGIIGSLIFILAFGIADIYGTLNRLLDGMSDIHL